MKAAVRERYGPPEAVELRDVEKPELPADGVLVRVRAASLNRYDWYSLGSPVAVRAGFGLLKPKERVLGVDFAGTVEAVGAGVTDFAPGDDVFGGGSGALAEYVCARVSVTKKPANVSFEEAAAVSMAGLTALQGLRAKGNLRAGQRVVVNGASGGVGTFAVQIAKALGAEVTAVCGTRNVELARELGADHVVDYTREDFTRSGRRYDLVFDVAGSRSWREYRRVMTPDGTLVVAGGPKGGAVLGPLSHIAAIRIASIRGSQKAVFFVAKPNREELALLAELVESGKVKPFVDRVYPLDEVVDALRYQGEGHPRGKVVVTV
jgi:NADPH:quinone reductase-like Zn-dependent oxidoreductase